MVDARVDELPQFVSPETLVVLNDTRVRKARIPAQAEESGARAEFLLVEEVRRGVWRVLVKRARRHKAGKKFIFPDGVAGTILEDQERLKLLEFDRRIDEQYLDRFGRIPLPPYIRRADTIEDADRYQTVYARDSGSIAAPTAGLHLTSAILNALRTKGAEIASLTLHIGPGTFLPVNTEEVEDFRLDPERVCVPVATATHVEQALAKRREILAVGTTVVRTLESAWKRDRIISGARQTDLFIYPDFRFRVVSALLTNFHLPGSSLLMLISAFAGKTLVLEAYRHAIEKRYRFYSYGDAMLIL